MVIIDSITRLNTKKLEDSSNAEYITRNLRSIAYQTKVTLICIHHTHKLRDSNLVMDSIKGSSTFAQEADFAIGIARSSKGHRYFKDILSRYAGIDDQIAHEFEIDSSQIINKIGESDEDELLSRTDGRKSNTKDQILEYFKSNPEKAVPIKELVSHVENHLGHKERTTKDYATKLYRDGLLTNEKGVYKLKK